MIYPKTIQIENDKLKDLLIKKAELITKGRGISDEIDTMEKDLNEIDLKIQEEEKKVNIDDILLREKMLVQQVEQAIEDMKVLKKEIYDRMIKEVPKELHTKYDEIKKAKEKKEEERNKIALKAQKYNDKIIPLGKELMKPFLEDQYEDYETISLENGEIVATIFSHLNDFKVNFKKR